MRVSIRIRAFELLHEAPMTERASDVGVRRGGDDRHVGFALVAEIALRRGGGAE